MAPVDALILVAKVAYSQTEFPSSLEMVAAEGLLLLAKGLRSPPKKSNLALPSESKLLASQESQDEDGESEGEENLTPADLSDRIAKAELAKIEAIRAKAKARGNGKATAKAKATSAKPKKVPCKICKTSIPNNNHEIYRHYSKHLRILPVSDLTDY